MTSDRRQEISELRHRLEAQFSPDTAYSGTRHGTASAGHCAIVAAITALTVGGQLVKTSVGGVSHWFNRLTDRGMTWDVDLTGDQFGLPAVQIAPEGHLYSDTKEADFSSLDRDTLRRAVVLADRAGLDVAQKRLLAMLDAVQPVH